MSAISLAIHLVFLSICIVVSYVIHQVNGAPMKLSDLLITVAVYLMTAVGTDLFLRWKRRRQ